MISSTVLYFYLGVCKANCHFGNCGNSQRYNLIFFFSFKDYIISFWRCIAELYVNCASIISMLDLLPLQIIKSLYSCQCYKFLLDLNQIYSLWWIPSQLHQWNTTVNTFGKATRGGVWRCAWSYLILLIYKQNQDRPGHDSLIQSYVNFARQRMYQSALLLLKKTVRT